MRTTYDREYKRMNYDAQSDEQLMELICQDPNHIAELVRRYESKLSRYVRRISSVSSEECEDILQEVFIKVYRNARGFDSTLSASSWVYRITHNEVISRHRKWTRRPKVTHELDDVAHVIADEFDLHADLEQKDLQREIRACINALPEKYRDVLVLKVIEQKSYQEISDILKKPIGTVGTLVNRAKKQCKKELSHLI
jgi:RNA polymerase sigma-70 factor (ECF subfamily)